MIYTCCQLRSSIIRSYTCSLMGIILDSQINCFTQNTRYSSSVVLIIILITCNSFVSLFRGSNKVFALACGREHLLGNYFISFYPGPAFRFTGLVCVKSVELSKWSSKTFTLYFFDRILLQGFWSYDLFSYIGSGCTAEGLKHTWIVGFQGNVLKQKHIFT